MSSGSRVRWRVFGGRASCSRIARALRSRVTIRSSAERNTSRVGFTDAREVLWFSSRPRQRAARTSHSPRSLRTNPSRRSSDRRASRAACLAPFRRALAHGRSLGERTARRRRNSGDARPDLPGRTRSRTPPLGPDDPMARWRGRGRAGLLMLSYLHHRELVPIPREALDALRTRQHAFGAMNLAILPASSIDTWSAGDRSAGWSAPGTSRSRGRHSSNPARPRATSCACPGTSGLRDGVPCRFASATRPREECLVRVSDVYRDVAAVSSEALRIQVDS
jgi:hypothetical protein